MVDEQQDTETKSTQNVEDKEKKADVSVNTEALIEQIDKYKAEAEKNWDLLLRTRAELENIQRRAKIDVENAHKYGFERFAREILNVVDSLEHGLKASESENEEVRAIHDGMVLTEKLFMDALDKFGIKQIEAVGTKFDPKQHEALTMVETDAQEPNTVLQVIQAGFILNDRVLRPARVIVAKELAKT